VAKPFLKKKRESEFLYELRLLQEKTDMERGRMITALEENFLM
jgi:hypothetical protein